MKQPLRTTGPAAVGTLFVTNSDSNTVSVINGATNTVIATIPVGLFPSAIDSF
ncbi:hypothetical protein [Bacillus proteolyticus]|uniref:hypothetical protein n=1 Tax=Bacillus proteolyticus TaxID=2026192 RepID=UPI001C312400